MTATEFAKRVALQATSKTNAGTNKAAQGNIATKKIVPRTMARRPTSRSRLTKARQPTDVTKKTARQLKAKTEIRDPHTTVPHKKVVSLDNFPSHNRRPSKRATEATDRKTQDRNTQEHYRE